LHLGRSENTALYHGAGRVDLEAKVLEDRVVRPVEHLETVLNRLPALARRSDSELDHVGRLPLVTLERVALVLVDLRKYVLASLSVDMNCTLESLQSNVP